MNKIIKGKRYNTDAAKAVANDTNGLYGDLNYWEETLFRKSTGEYFLYGAGGPMSKYAETIGQNEWSGGERIIPLTTESAMAWAEEHLTGDEYEKIFGAVEDDSKRTATFYLTEATIEMIARLAVKHGCSKSDVIEMAIENFR